MHACDRSSRTSAAPVLSVSASEFSPAICRQDSKMPRAEQLLPVDYDYDVCLTMTYA